MATTTRLLALTHICLIIVACVSAPRDEVGPNPPPPTSATDEAKLKRILAFQAALKQAEGELESLEPDLRAARVEELRRSLSAPVASPRVVPTDRPMGRDEQIMVASAELDRLPYEEREERIRKLQPEVLPPGARAALAASPVDETRNEDDAVALYLKEAQTLQASWPENPTAEDYARLENLKKKYLAAGSRESPP